MRRRLLPIAAAVSFFAAAACPSSDTSSSDNDAGAPDATYDATAACDSFTTHDAPCSPISPIVCFAQCTRGGCKCTAGPDGKGVWKCVVDTSCLPDAPPDFDANGGPDEAGVDDGASESGTDAASDGASVDGANESGADATDDAASDGGVDAPGDG